MTTKPAGAEYICVPREPDWEMQAAARDCDWPLPNIYGVFDNMDKDSAASDIYKAMLAASPRPAPDAGVIELAAIELCDHRFGEGHWIEATDDFRNECRAHAGIVLAAAGLLKGADSGDAGKLREALRSLSGNAKCLAAFEAGVREAIGNTNYNCILDACAEADKALALPLSSLPASSGQVDAKKMRGEP